MPYLSGALTCAAGKKIEQLYCVKYPFGIVSRRVGKKQDSDRVMNEIPFLRLQESEYYFFITEYTI